MAPYDNIDALGKVAVVMGGSSAERQISLQSGAAVTQALQLAGVNATAVDMSGEGMAIAMQLAEYDRVFIALHGRGGEDGTLQRSTELRHDAVFIVNVMAGEILISKRDPAGKWLASNCRARCGQETFGTWMG